MILMVLRITVMLLYFNQFLQLIEKLFGKIIKLKQLQRPNFNSYVKIKIHKKFVKDTKLCWMVCFDSWTLTYWGLLRTGIFVILYHGLPLFAGVFHQDCAHSYRN